MSQNKPIRRIAIIGTGVIGASWTSLFLAKGLQVVATDVAPNAEAALKKFVADGLAGAQAIGPFVRSLAVEPEVHRRARASGRRMPISSRRTDPSGSISSRSSMDSWTSCCRPT